MGLGKPGSAARLGILGMLLTVAACLRAAGLPALDRAEAAARRHEVTTARLAFREAQVTCQQLTNLRVRHALCARAFLGEAQLMAHHDLALARQLMLQASALPMTILNDTTRAAALTQAADLAAQAGQIDDALVTYLHVVRYFAEEPSAGEALRRYVRLAPPTQAEALTIQLHALWTAQPAGPLADNLVWHLAELTETQGQNAARARAYYDQLYRDYPQSGLHDDARWHAARLSRALGDAEGAVTRLKGLLATHEVARLSGSYFSIWLDNAQLELGRVLRDDLGRIDEALQVFADLPARYPASILRDDAAYEHAMTLHRRAPAAPQTCQAFDDFARRFPASKFRVRLPLCPGVRP